MKEPGIEIRKSMLIKLGEAVTRRDQKKPLDLMTVRPQAKQEELLEACGLLDWYWDRGGIKQCVASIVGFGGAAYGGKTFGMMILSAVAALAWPGVQIAYFRRTYTQIFGPGGVSNDARNVFAGMGRWRDEGRQFDFENGSQFYFRHCENENDVYKYDGQQFDIVIFDEATHMSWRMVDYLMGRNRVSGPNGIPRPFCVMPTNPGNIGHSWYYNLFDVGKKIEGKKGTTGYSQIKTVTNENGIRVKTYFIQARVADNPIGLSRDPEYPDRLRTQDPARAAALLEGDWESFAGQMYTDFSQARHVIRPREFPASWPTICGIDGGQADPYCCLWGKVEPRTGRVYVYREQYQPGVTHDVQADRIRMASRPEDNILVYFGDPDYFWTERNTRGEYRTPFDDYLEHGILLTKGDGDRINGVLKIHQMLADGADGKPLLQITENCYNLINELPKLPVDLNRREDVDPKAEQDHAHSALKYLLSNVQAYMVTEEVVTPNGRRIPRKDTNPMQKIKGL